MIQNGAPDGVSITGTHQIIESLHVRADAPSTDPHCQNQPVGWRAGFTFQNGAAYNTVRASQASEMTTGVLLARDAHHNRVLNNQLTNNRVMSVNTNNGGADDSGAWGILVHGSDNEIAHNYFSGNTAWCSYDFGIEGASVEMFEGRRNTIHHNVSVNDTTFTELGSSSALQAADNTYAYNLYHNTQHAKSEFLTLRGAGDSFGPTWRTRVFNNTVYLTGDESKGVSCFGGCSAQILELRNNILWVNNSAAFADAPFKESHNIFWKTGGNPFVDFRGFEMHAASMKANPLFVKPRRLDFHLTASSPARNAGHKASVRAGFTTDLDGVSVPQGKGVEIGGYEIR